jgi:hypothetical protein
VMGIVGWVVLGQAAGPLTNIRMARR